MTAALADNDIQSILSTTNWGDSAKCTSRSEHNCTTDATHVSRSTKPCPDPAERVLWCAARFALHQRHGDSTTCHYCERKCVECWNVYPV